MGWRDQLQNLVYRRLLSTLCAGALLSSLPARADLPFRTVLPNGIPVVLQDTYASPTVSINIFIRVGGVFEPKALSGISHFYEHMFFRGTPTRTGLDFKRQIEALGGTTNANTGKDFTHFYINLPKQYLDEGLAILADAYLNAECSQESIDAERKVVLEEWRLGKANPMREFSDQITSMVFKKSPYANNVIGSESTIKHIVRADLLNWKHTYYVPGRTDLVVVGEFDRAETLAKIKTLFGSYDAPAPAVDVIPTDEPPSKTVVTNVRSRFDQSAIFFGYLGPSIKDVPDVYRLDLLCFMLSNGKHSLLAKEFAKDDKPQEPAVDYLTQAYPGIVTVSVSSKPGAENETLARVDKVMDAVQKGTFSEQDIHRARQLLRNTYNFGNESNSGKADNLGFYETLDNVDFANQYLSNIDKVTKADLMACAQKYFGRPHYELIVQAAPKKREAF
jgi:zinc protease